MDPRATYERRSELQILDVREPDEWAEGHIPDAVHIPMDQVPERLDELDRDRPVVAVCRSGRRSGEVVDYLSRLGISAENMPGGMVQWADQGLPIKRP
ncbi:MAG: rhodanese-like domain-containing protein [Actinomycetes bacterium]